MFHSLLHQHLRFGELSECMMGPDRNMVTNKSTKEGEDFFIC